MKTKNLSIYSSIILVVLAFVTIFANPLIGYYGYFRTDFTLNMIHFLTGIALVIVALEFSERTSLVLRAVGVFYIVLAVLGALTTGFDAYGTMFGLIAVSGPLHILHLLLGVAFITIGTRELRIDGAK